MLIYAILSIMISSKYYNYLCMIKREYVCSLLWPDCLLLMWFHSFFSLSLSLFCVCIGIRFKCIGIHDCWWVRFSFHAMRSILWMRDRKLFLACEWALRLLLLPLVLQTHPECPRCTWAFTGISKWMITMTQKYAYMHDFVRLPTFSVYCTYCSALLLLLLL